MANDILSTALELIAEGFSVLPVYRSKNPDLDKHPVYELLPVGEDGKPTWGLYQKEIADEATVRRWFTNTTHNLAIIGGRVSGNLLMPDFDQLDSAKEWYEPRKALLNGVPRERTGRASGEGRHFFLRTDVPVACSKGDGFDFKGEGGYCVVTPSIHGVTGQPYELLEGDMSKVPVIEAALLGLGGSAQEVNGKPAGWEIPLLEDVPEGERNNRMTQLVGRWIEKRLDEGEVMRLALATNAGWRNSLPEAEVLQIVDSVFKTHERKHEPATKKIGPLPEPVSFLARQAADMPPRVWFIDGMVTPGFNMLTAKKAQGKSFLLMQMAQAIAEGRPFLGRQTTQAKVLFVSFELDEGDMNERFKGMERLSENAFLLHSWPGPKDALTHAERYIVEQGFKVLIFDTFLPLIPQDGNFKLNEYGDSILYLGWRLLGKHNGAAILASWHEGKTPREDFMLNFIGSMGMGGQADSIISIDRKQRDAAGKLFIGGNHAPDAAIPIVFENGIFRLGEGAVSMDRLTRDEEKTIATLQGHPEVTTAAVALAMGKNEDAARKSLNRLRARGKVTKIKPGVYSLNQTGQPDNSGQFHFSPIGQPDRTGQHPIGVSGLSGMSGPKKDLPNHFEDDIPFLDSVTLKKGGPDDLF